MCHLEQIIFKHNLNIALHLNHSYISTTVFNPRIVYSYENTFQLKQSLKMAMAKKWTMVKAWDKAANMSNFKLEEETLPDTLGKGGNYYVLVIWNIVRVYFFRMFGMCRTCSSE